MTPRQAKAGVTNAQGAAKPVLKFDWQKDFVFPVKGHPTFRNEFGVGSHRGGVWQNNGTDIFARRGTTVVAPISGRIALRTGGKGGNRFEIARSDGVKAYGAHLDRFFNGVRVGQAVKAGQPIGYVGNTGNARTTSSHLHLSMARGAKPINPFPILTTNVRDHSRAARRSGR